MERRKTLWKRSGKVLFALYALLASLCATAQTEGYLARLAATMKAADPYEVAFAIEGDGLRVEGEYAVSGDRYRIILPDAEVWGEGTMRYEVDHRRKTITLMPVDTTARNLLDNPTRAFDFVATEYPSRLLAHEADKAIIELISADNPLTTVRLTLSLPDLRPRAVRYEIDGIGVDVQIGDLATLKEPLPGFAPSRYPDYEVVDFR